MYKRANPSIREHRSQRLAELRRRKKPSPKRERMLSNASRFYRKNGT